MERRTTTDRLLRARAQAIGGEAREESVAAVLDRVLAVQAQDLPAAELGLRVRARGLTQDAVRRATDTERTVIRGWFMRGTLQLVPAADARWLLALFGPIHLALAARRLRELGLDESLCARSERLITEAIAAEGPLTRAQLTDRLTTLGVEPKGQSAFHLIRRAALAGRVCHGPQREGRPPSSSSTTGCPRPDRCPSPEPPPNANSPAATAWRTDRPTPWTSSTGRG